MQQSSYIKFLLTILVIAVIFFAIVGIQALDRIYQSNQKILAKLEQLSQKEFVTKVDRENYQTLSLDNKAKAVNIANISNVSVVKGNEPVNSPILYDKKTISTTLASAS